MKIKQVIIENIFTYYEKTMINFEYSDNIIREKDKQSTIDELRYINSIKSFLVFVGSNNSGKSNFFRLLEIFCHLMDDSGNFTSEWNRYYSVWGERINHNGNSNISQVSLLLTFSLIEKKIFDEYFSIIHNKLKEKIETFFLINHNSDTTKNFESNYISNIIKTIFNKIELPETQKSEIDIFSLGDKLKTKILDIINIFFTQINKSIHNLWITITYNKTISNSFIRLDITIPIQIEGSTLIVNIFKTNGFSPFLKLKYIDNDIDDKCLFDEYKFFDPNNTSSISFFDLVDKALIPILTSNDSYNLSEDTFELPINDIFRLLSNENRLFNVPDIKVSVYTSLLKSTITDNNINLDGRLLNVQGNFHLLFIILLLIRNRIKFFNGSSLYFNQNFKNIDLKQPELQKLSKTSILLAVKLYELKNNMNLQQRIKFRDIQIFFSKFFPNISFDVYNDAKLDETVNNSLGSVFIPICIEYKDKNNILQQLHLDKAAAGMTQILTILTFIVEANDYDILCLDEPTLSLHSTLESKLRIFFEKEVINKRNNQIFLITHSQTLIRPSKLVENLFYFRKDNELNTIVINDIFSLLSPDITHRINTNLIFRVHTSEILFANTILLVEGHDDENTLLSLDQMFSQKSLSNYNSIKFEEQDILILPIGGKDNFFSYYEILDKLHIKFVTILDGDALVFSNSPVSKKKSKDIKNTIISFIEHCIEKKLITPDSGNNIIKILGNNTVYDFNNSDIVNIIAQLKSKNIYILNVKSIEQLIGLPETAKGWEDIEPQLIKINEELEENSFDFKNYPHLEELLQWLYSNIVDLTVF